MPNKHLYPLSHLSLALFMLFYISTKQLIKLFLEERRRRRKQQQIVGLKAQWFMLLIPAFWRLRQFKASLGHISNSRLA